MNERSIAVLHTGKQVVGRREWLHEQQRIRTRVENVGDPGRAGSLYSRHEEK